MYPMPRLRNRMLLLGWFRIWFLLMPISSRVSYLLDVAGVYSTLTFSIRPDYFYQRDLGFQLKFFFFAVATLVVTMFTGLSSYIILNIQQAIIEDFTLRLAYCVLRWLRSFP